MDNATLINHLTQEGFSKENTPEEPETPQEEETKSPEEPTDQATDTQEDEDINKSMSELLGGKEEQKSEEKSNDTVPLATYLELKSELAEIKRQDMTKSQESESLKALAEEYDVDADFVQKLGAVLTAEAEKKVKEKYEPFIQKQQQSEIEKKQNEVFDSLYGKILKSNPEMEGIVNKDVIKALAFDKSNANKSVKQIINEVYGGAIEKADLDSVSSFEKGSVATRKETTTIDFNNLSKKDFDRIESDPKLKEQYGEFLTSQTNLL